MSQPNLLLLHVKSQAWNRIRCWSSTNRQ